MASLIADLCLSHAITPPDEKGQHFHANFGLFQLRWEKHTEFDSLQIYEGQAIGDQRYSSFLLRRFGPAERNAANLTLRIASVQKRSQRIVNLL